MRKRVSRARPAGLAPHPEDYVGWVRWHGTEWRMACKGCSDVIAWMLLCEHPVPPGAWCVDRRVLPRGRAPWEGGGP
jgi:hypothetical protein